MRTHYSIIFPKQTNTGPDGQTCALPYFIATEKLIMHTVFIKNY